MQQLFNTPYTIYTATAVFILCVSIIEIIMSIGGLSLSKIFSLELDADVAYAEGDFGLDTADSLDALGAASLLHVGKVPFFLIIISFGIFFSFSGIGTLLALKSYIAESSIPTMFEGAVLAFSVLNACAGTWLIASLWARFLPSHESFVLKEKEYIGLSATVHLGQAKFEEPAEISLYDRFGERHYLMASSALPGHEFSEGQKVRVVGKKHSAEYLILPFN